MCTSSIHGEGSSWSFNQPDGKERHRRQSHLSCHSPLYAPLVSRHFPFLAFNIFLPLLAPPTTPLYLSISIASSLTRSFPCSPRGAEVVEGHSDLARFQHGGSERGGENETTKVQQCTVNTFAPIKLVKTSKKCLLEMLRAWLVPQVCSGRSLSQDIPHCIHLLRIRALSWHHTCSSHSKTICLTDWKILAMSAQLSAVFLIINPHLNFLLLCLELKIATNLTIKQTPANW